MKKLITHTELFNRKTKNEMFYVFMFSIAIVLLTYAIGLLIFDEKPISYIFLLPGLIFAIVFYTICRRVIIKENKKCRYIITEDVVVKKEIRAYRRRYNEVDITFQKIGKWTFKGEKQYNTLEHNDKVFVIKNFDNFLIVDVLLIGEYEISLNEFELKNDRYYSKKNIGDSFNDEKQI